MRTGIARSAIASTLVMCGMVAVTLGAQLPAMVQPVPPPATPVPSEAASAGVTRFSFVVYGDSRSRHDGLYIQPDHLMVAERILTALTQLSAAPDPIRFALFTGDGVVNGRDATQWNVSFSPVVSRLTQSGLPYFMAAGNHDVTAGVVA